MKSLTHFVLITGGAAIMACSMAIAGQSNPEEQAQAQWRETMINVETPQAGCYQATYPDIQWESASCGTVTEHAHPLPRHAKAGEPQTTGDGNDYALVAASLISKTVGSFPTVSGVTSESSVGVPAFGDGGILGANEYSLQINTNANSKTSVCSGGASGCTVWQQFIYATDYETKGSGAAFMQYWLLGYGTCPSGWSNGGGGDCYKNSSYVSVPDVAITGLANLKLTGAAVSGGNDTVTFANGTQAYSVTALDSVLQMGTVWTQSEFNVVGDAGGSEAVFNSGASITVNVAATDGSTAAPTCKADAGTTGETNNLNLGTCTATGGSTPSVQFKESLVSVPITLTVALTSVGGGLTNPVIFTIDGKSYGTITQDETVASITIQSGTAVNVTVTNAPLTGSEYPVCVLYSATGITVTSTEQPLVITGTASTTNANITVDCFGFGGD
jgi:hypothetical protein